MSRMIPPARNGPAADPGSLKRTRDGKDWVKLRPEGRGPDASVPAWPLVEDPGEAAEVQYERDLVGQLRDQWAEADGGAIARDLAKKLDKAERALVVHEARIAARAEQELDLWTRLWAMPQAQVWEADESHLQVALYARAFTEASWPGAQATARVLALRLANELLLTIPALHAMRYVIDRAINGAAPADLTGEAAAQPDAPAAPAAEPGRRSRFKVHDGGEAAG